MFSSLFLSLSQFKPGRGLHKVSTMSDKKEMKYKQFDDEAKALKAVLDAVKSATGQTDDQLAALKRDHKVQVRFCVLHYDKDRGEGSNGWMALVVDKDARDSKAAGSFRRLFKKAVKDFGHFVKPGFITLNEGEHLSARFAGELGDHDLIQTKDAVAIAGDETKRRVAFAPWERPRKE